MNSRMQSAGNLVGSTGWKARFWDGAVEGTVAALGRIEVGEVLTLTAVRLLVDGVELPGAVEASAWQPWEVSLDTPQVAVRRSTTFEDQHVQWFEIQSAAAGSITVWIEFETRSPLKIAIDDGVVYWESELGRVVAVACNPAATRVVTGCEAADVRRLWDAGVDFNGWAQVGELRDSHGVVACGLPAGRSGVLALAVGRTRQEALEKLTAAQGSPQTVLEHARGTWEQFFADNVPACPRAGYEELWREAWYVLRANRMDYANPPLSHPFTSPSKFNYPHQWLWDSAFHAIVWRWLKSSDWARMELSNLLEHPLEHGRLCHEIHFSPWVCELNYQHGHQPFAPTSQPPVMAIAVELVHQRDKNDQWLRQTLPKLVAYLQWWHIARDPDHDDLAGWGCGWESGLDNSPRWDHVAQAGKLWFPAPVEATELNALLVQEWRAVARLAGHLGQTKIQNLAESWAGRIKSAMIERLWDTADEFFYCRDHREKPIRMKTVGGLLGLLALDPGDAQVSGLLRHLTDEREFWTPYPIPSVARDEPSFTTGQMWRGPTWINTNWLLIRSLERLKQGTLAVELARRTLAMVQSEGSAKLWEWYDPITGRALGNKDYSWSALVIDLLMDQSGHAI